MNVELLSLFEMGPNYYTNITETGTFAPNVTINVDYPHPFHIFLFHTRYQEEYPLNEGNFIFSTYDKNNNLLSSVQLVREPFHHFKFNSKVKKIVVSGFFPVAPELEPYFVPIYGSIYGMMPPYHKDLEVKVVGSTHYIYGDVVTNSNYTFPLNQTGQPVHLFYQLLFPGGDLPYNSTLNIKISEAKLDETLRLKTDQVVEYTRWAQWSVDPSVEHKRLTISHTNFEPIDVSNIDAHMLAVLERDKVY